MSALELLGGLVLEDGRTWAATATPWQWADARAVLVDRARMAYLTRPRGASKTTDAGAFAIVALLEQLAPNSRSYAAAVDSEQASLLVDAIAGFVARTPGLGGALKVDTSRVTATRSGATLEVLAADAASAFGRLPHLLVVDELAQWATTPGPRRLWEALFSALPKVADSRLVILTTAGDPAHPAHRLLVRARSAARWYVDEVAGPCPWVSASDLAEQRAELTESQYNRLHLNRWSAPEDSLVSPEDLAACVTLDGPLDPEKGKRYAAGLDLGLRSDRTVLSVCHAEHRPDGAPGAVRVVLDRQAVWQGTRSRPVSLDEVEAYCLKVHAEYRPQFIVDPYQAAQLSERLRRRGCRIAEFTFSQSSVGRLAQRMYLLLRDRALALPPDEALLDELATVRLRETSPGVFRIDHDSSRHDDRAISLALAAHFLTEKPLSSPFSSGAKTLLAHSSGAGDDAAAEALATRLGLPYNPR